jgi:hypothetical protein
MYKLAMSKEFPTSYFHLALKSDLERFFENPPDTEFDLADARISKDIMNDVISRIIRSTEYIFVDSKWKARDNLLRQAMGMRELRKEIAPLPEKKLPIIGKPIESHIKEYCSKLSKDVVYTTRDSEMSTAKLGALIFVLNVILPEIKISITSIHINQVHSYIQHLLYGSDDQLETIYRDTKKFTLIKDNNEVEYEFCDDPSEGIYIMGRGSYVSFEDIMKESMTAVLPSYFGKEVVFQTRSKEVRELFSKLVARAFLDFNKDPDHKKVNLKEVLLGG